MGVHIIDNVKVYYLALPHAPSLKAIFPTYLLEYPEAWRILTHEGIDIVHCHQTSSTLATSYAIFAKTLNLKVVHTEHSLFGYKSIAYIHFNFFLHVLFPHYDRLITVSRATRNNLLLRAGVKPSRAVVIPNTVKAKSCTRNKCKTDSIRVVVVGRLVYRRGIDLLMSMLVPLCNRNPKMDMTVIGDGPKM